LVPQLETGKINCVRLPRYDRLPPGGAWITLKQRIGSVKRTLELLAKWQNGRRGTEASAERLLAATAGIEAGE
jgi:hypothetical protein